MHVQWSTVGALNVCRSNFASKLLLHVWEPHFRVSSRKKYIGPILRLMLRPLHEDRSYSVIRLYKV